MPTPWSSSGARRARGGRRVAPPSPLPYFLPLLSQSPSVDARRRGGMRQRPFPPPPGSSSRAPPPAWGEGRRGGGENHSRIPAGVPPCCSVPPVQGCPSHCQQTGHPAATGQAPAHELRRPAPRTGSLQASPIATTTPLSRRTVRPAPRPSRTPASPSSRWLAARARCSQCGGPRSLRCASARHSRTLPEAAPAAPPRPP